MDSLVVQMNKILDEYSKEVTETYQESSAEVANEAVKKLRSVKFKTNNRGYSRSWGTTKTDRMTIVIHNKKHYRLTHLLENGHAIANQHGKYAGRVPAIKHIQPVEEWANRKLIEKIESKL